VSGGLLRDGRGWGGTPYTARMRPRYRRLVITGLLVGLILIAVVAAFLD
jgi:hypothetical protein